MLFNSMTVNMATADSAVGLKKAKQEGFLAYYSGSVTLAGEFWYPIAAGEREVVGDQLCFNMDEKDAQLIPREPDDTRSPWFCFKKTPQAVKRLGLTELARLNVCELRGKPQKVTAKLLYEGGGACDE